MRKARWVWCLAAMCLLRPMGFAAAQVAATAAGDATTVPAVLLSDIHFDPFRDPAKVAQLAELPETQWDRVLNEKATPARAAEQAASYQEIQKACGGSGDDTDEALLNATLSEAKKHVAKNGFVTVSGDLLVHGFSCRYEWATRKKPGGDWGRFAAETVKYVMRKVDAAFPNQPVYFALGNNDSGCGDYRLNGHDRFLAETSEALLHGLRGAGAEELKRAREDYEAGGYYGVAIGGGVTATRLLVVDDIYESNAYEGCPAKKDGTGTAVARNADPQLKWLETELAAAKARGEKVWVMGHIPPGPDAFNTLKHFFSVCTRPPAMFLSSNALGDALVSHADVIQLALFGHSHMDEMRLLERDGQAGSVAMKLVPAVSPLRGNSPAFTVAQVSAATGGLNDYAVFTTVYPLVVPNSWTREYGYRETYHQADYSAASVRTLVENMQDDAGAVHPESKAYASFFSAGGEGSPLFVVWPQYGCALTNDRAEDFKNCLCPAK